MSYRWGVWETLQSGAAWHAVGTGAAWCVTLCLLLAGMVGCVLPVLPGHLILFIAAVAHRLMLGAAGSGLEWWSFLVLGLLMAISQTFEMLSGAAGTRWFGGSRWGALGALIGSIAGLFFLPLGLLLGPLLGAFAFEIGFAKRPSTPAMVSGVGSVVGTLTGMVFKIVIGALMVLWFFLDVWVIG
ncbi:MAG: DUF456 family protein [Verrucomicrobiota bacterium]